LNGPNVGEVIVYNKTKWPIELGRYDNQNLFNMDSEENPIRCSLSNINNRWLIRSKDLITEYVTGAWMSIHEEIKIDNKSRIKIGDNTIYFKLIY